MKLNKIILSGTAILVTALTAFAFKSSNRFQNPTLATWNGSVYTNVPCARNGGGGACSNGAVTYYTRSAQHHVITTSAFAVSD